jgi:hypothetical protein
MDSLDVDCLSIILAKMTAWQLLLLWRTGSIKTRLCIEKHCQQFGCHLDINRELYHWIGGANAFGLDPLMIFVENLPMWANVKSLTLWADIGEVKCETDGVIFTSMLRCLSAKYPRMVSIQLEIISKKFFDETLPHLPQLCVLKTGRFAYYEAGVETDLSIRTISQSIVNLTVQAQYLKRFVCKNLQVLHLIDWSSRRGELKILKNCLHLRTLTLESGHWYSKRFGVEIKPMSLLKKFQTLPQITTLRVIVPVFIYMSKFRYRHHRPRKEVQELCQHWVDATSTITSTRTLQICEKQGNIIPYTWTESEMVALSDDAHEQGIYFQYICPQDFLKQT